MNTHRDVRRRRFVGTHHTAEQGHNLFELSHHGSQADADLTVSRAAAVTTIGIPTVFDASDIFESQVIQPCADAYSRD